jgi:Na+/melibiose symporter-like transporter
MSATVKILTEAAIELEPIRSSVSQRGHGSDARSLVSNKSNNTPAPIPASSTQDDARSVNSVKLQLLSCCVCFIVAGLNDGSLGTLLPYLLSTYNLSTSFVGIMYATSFAGWFLAAMVMPFMVDAVGSKGTLLAGAILYTIAQVLRVWVALMMNFVVYTQADVHV